jgi:hypothetical protein
VVIVFIPGFQIHATLRVARRFDQTQNLGVVFDRRLHFADADRYVSRTQHAINSHDLSFLAAQRMPTFMGRLRSSWGPRHR